MQVTRCADVPLPDKFVTGGIQDLHKRQDGLCTVPNDRFDQCVSPLACEYIVSAFRCSRLQATVSLFATVQTLALIFQIAKL